MKIKKLIPWVGLLVISLGLTTTSIIQQIRVHYGTKIVTKEAVIPAKTAIILGASVTMDGRPSDALRDRVLTGIDLYKSGKAEQLLMTGDDGGFHANEVAVMKRLAMEAGVPEKDILVDGRGYRTYESCKRAVQTLNIRQAIIVTQEFHLARSLYLCSQLGMQVQGVSADRQTYQRIVFFTLRDLAASFKAWWDINIDPPPSPVAY